MAAAEGGKVTLEGLIARSIRNIEAIRGTPGHPVVAEAELAADLESIRDMVRGVDLVFDRMGVSPIGTLSEADARLKLADAIRAVDAADVRVTDLIAMASDAAESMADHADDPHRVGRAVSEFRALLAAMARHVLDRPWAPSRAMGPAVAP